MALIRQYSSHMVLMAVSVDSRFLLALPHHYVVSCGRCNSIIAGKGRLMDITVLLEELASQWVERAAGQNLSGLERNRLASEFFAGAVAAFAAIDHPYAPHLAASSLAKVNLEGYRVVERLARPGLALA